MSFTDLDKNIILFYICVAFKTTKTTEVTKDSTKIQIIQIIYSIELKLFQKRLKLLQCYIQK